MRCIGLDVGSSSIKGAILDLERGTLGAVVKTDFPPPVPGLPAGHFEVDPQRIEAAVASVLGKLCDADPKAGALFCCGQMGGTILVDGTGAPLTNYLSWRDQRALAPSEHGTLLSDVQRHWGPSLLASVGNELHAGSAPVLLHGLTREGRLPAYAIPASITDFVLGRLCGELPQMHATQAIGMLDLAAGTWHGEALERLGLDQLRWPALTELQVPVGRARLSGRTLTCYAAVGDQQCALYGARLAVDELSLNISTGSQVSCRTATFQPGPYQTRCYFGGEFLNTITHLPAGRSLNVLVALLSQFARDAGVLDRDPWDWVVAQTSDSQPLGLEVDLAFFAGPLGSSGSIRGITTDNLTVGNLFTAAFQAMAENYATCAARLWPAQSWRQIALSGGLPQRVPPLRRQLQRRFNAPLRDADVAEETLSGLLALARAVFDP